MASAYAKRLWLEEDLGDDYRWSYRVTRVLFSGKSEFQEIDLVDTPTWGKVLLLDGKMQSTEADEQLYHELLVHPAMLHHHHPRTVFIMGGGEGATAREVLRHSSVQQVVMVDIDKVVTDFCARHLLRNTAAFADPRLTLINDDARSQLESWPGTFDVIIGDLADPLEGGPCYQLYTQEFYETVVRRKLAPGGIFVTQSGPAGLLSAKEVFSTIHRTVSSVFPTVVPYAQHIPSFCECWGFNLAFSHASTRPLTPREFDEAAAARISGELVHVDGATFAGTAMLSKTVRKALAEETQVYTTDNLKFIHGTGVNAACSSPPSSALATSCGTHSCGSPPKAFPVRVSCLDAPASPTASSTVSSASLSACWEGLPGSSRDMEGMSLPNGHGTVNGHVLANGHGSAIEHSMANGHSTVIGPANAEGDGNASVHELSNN
ncbi:S-adenosyl-L-methionine-dependent methyltransferase [Haematococcus lacustris]